MTAESLKTKEQLREYLASAELQEVLRNTLSGILKRDDLPSAGSLVRTLGEELITFAEAEGDEEGQAEDDEEERRMMAMRGKRRTGVSAESTSTMQTQEKSTAVKTEKSAEQKERIEKAISGNLLFEGITGEQKEELFACMFEKTVEVGVNVITQGEEGDNFYVLDDGECDIFVGGKKVGSIANGGSFGELALMYSAPRAATITTTAATSLWAMDRITFRSMLFDKANAKRAQYLEFLNSVQLLDPMEDYEKGKIADVLENIEFADGDTVITEGDEGEIFYIVMEGGCLRLCSRALCCVWGCVTDLLLVTHRRGARHQACGRGPERGQILRKGRFLWGVGSAQKRTPCRNGGCQGGAHLCQLRPEAVHASGWRLRRNFDAQPGAVRRNQF